MNRKQHDAIMDSLARPGIAVDPETAAELVAIAKRANDIRCNHDCPQGQYIAWYYWEKALNKTMAKVPA